MSAPLVPASARIDRLAILGCGLIGGSLALALKAQGLVRHVVGISGSRNSEQQALQLGVIDHVASHAAQAVHDADVVVLAVPVAATEAILQQVATALPPNALLMDVGSTKQDVVAAMLRSLPQALTQCVPAHPIAGKEKAGVIHAQANLFEQRRVILTPLAQSAPEKVAQAQSIWQATGAQVHSMTPLQHDRTFAAVSHLPHLLAFAYINGLTAQEASVALMAQGGPGFRDFTRIAASDAQVWRDIFLANPHEILTQLNEFENALRQLRQALEAPDAKAIEQLIEQAAQARRDWPAQL